MTLQQLLTFLRETMLNDRSDRIEGSSDYLWTDETLVTFINEAQRRFAVRSLILRDASTDAATKIALVPGQNVYTLHESVFAVLSAKLLTADADLTRVGHATLAAYRAPTETWIDPATYQGMSPGGTVAYSTDEGLTADDVGFGQVQLRVYPTPAAAQAGTFLRLRVVRKPIAELTTSDLDASPELPKDHHIEMLDWAAYLALRIVDDDAGAPRRAAEFAGSFEEHVKAARLLVMRKLFAPTGPQFGRGGFSWEN